MRTLEAGTTEDLAALFAYPAAGGRARLREAVSRLKAAVPEAARPLDAFSCAVEPLSDTALEELFTQTFDLNPACALEIGWHIYGEEYERGAFLVRMREILRRLEIGEGTELPDHLCHALTAVGRLEDAQARDLARTKMIPALKKMREAAADNPYAYALAAAGLFLESRWPAAEGDEK